MKKYIAFVPVIVCLLSLAVIAAIPLTTPEVVPAKEATAAQIVEIRLRFYTDGQNMLSKVVDGKTVGTAEGYVEWRTGNGEAPNFQVVSAGKSVALTAEDLAAIMAAAKATTPAEADALVPALGVTPLDNLFQAIVATLKAKGKL